MHQLYIHLSRIKKKLKYAEVMGSESIHALIYIHIQIRIEHYLSLVLILSAFFGIFNTRCLQTVLLRVFVLGL